MHFAGTSCLVIPCMVFFDRVCNIIQGHSLCSPRPMSRNFYTSEGSQNLRRLGSCFLLECIYLALIYAVKFLWPMRFLGQFYISPVSQEHLQKLSAMDGQEYKACLCIRIHIYIYIKLVPVQANANAGVTLTWATDIAKTLGPLDLAVLLDKSCWPTLQGGRWHREWPCG